MLGMCDLWLHCVTWPYIIPNLVVAASSSFYDQINLFLPMWMITVRVVFAAINLHDPGLDDSIKYDNFSIRAYFVRGLVVLAKKLPFEYDLVISLDNSGFWDFD